MEHRELSNGYVIPSICYGTDIVDYRTTITGKLNKNFRFFAKKGLTFPARSGILSKLCVTRR